MDHDHGVKLGRFNPDGLDSSAAEWISYKRFWDPPWLTYTPTSGKDLSPKYEKTMKLLLYYWRAWQAPQVLPCRCLDKKIKLNREKLDFGATSLTFMGQRISSDGLQVDPEKVSAISKMREPTNLVDLRQFIGMVNYLAKFLPNLTILMRPLNNLLKKDVSWNWSSCQQEAFDVIKGQLTKTPVLATTIQINPWLWKMMPASTALPLLFYKKASQSPSLATPYLTPRPAMHR